MESKSSDRRKYFQSSNMSIFDVIENAITVAASDDQKEFMPRRGKIARKIYSCTLPECCCSDDSKLDSKEKERKSKENCNDEPSPKSNGEDEERACLDEVSKYSCQEVEALTDAMEEHSAIVDDVKRIKELLDNYQHLWDQNKIIESLRKLQLTVHSVQVLQETEIVTTVKRLSKHRSKNIRQLAKTLVTGWMTMVKEYTKFANNLEEDQSRDPNSSPRDDDAGGLSIPPMDKGIFLLPQQPPMELSEFFDGLDDNGDPEESREAEKFHESKSNAPTGNKRKPGLQRRDSSGQESTEKMSRPTNEERYHPLPSAENNRNPTSIRHEGTASVSRSRAQSPKKEFKEKSAKPRNYSPSDSNDSQRRLKQQRLLIEAEKMEEINKNMDKDKGLRSPKTAEKIPAEAHAAEAKLEISKRKLYQRYQEADKAKRYTKFIKDLPGDAFSRRNSGLKRKRHPKL